ncbi:phosphatase PAP2 family protein [Shewanella litorisediminis]|uniref:Phosphatase PAP2 family protein n=1 Tax=Shewanella litorisediminis TaxID=1173586 RepID=A0ABX7G3B2_9GAMM|nr:phosphatase PAP2 family protein [Shewanella litorisediminis]MCL2917333.1 phosphatase PAP2 family protein [Shewanella litorisediminis]QRH01801.1 phosphatase PAP2 family protein [Shewanella litorisediminis]
MPRIHFHLSPRHWWRRHLHIPLTLGLAFLVLATQWDWDLYVSSALFHLEGGVNAWPLRYWWLTDKVLHTGGRDLVVLASVLLLALTLTGMVNPRLKPYLRGFFYLLCSVAISVLLVRWGKSLTQVNCPWDLALFGGQYPHVSFPASMAGPGYGGQCFPGGHSSGAFAWVALYYFAVVYFPRWRWRMLASVLAVGALFSLTQELRGAHFLTHDITSLLLSWLVATLLYPLFWRRGFKADTAIAGAETVITD